jgi:hypothetical protein
MSFLAIREFPENSKDSARVLRASQFIKLTDEGKLYLENEHRIKKFIPPMKNRVKLIKDVATALAFPAGIRVYNLIKTQYFWEGMLADCRSICSSLVPLQKENAKFK